MSVIGCHALVWTGTFEREGLTRAVERTQRAGYDLLEIPLLRPFDFDVAMAKEVLADSGLEVSASMGLSDATDIGSEDPQIVAAGEETLNKTVDIVSALGGKHLCGVLYGVLKKYDGPATAQGRANSQDVLRRVARRASDAGVQLSLEVVNRYESNMFNTCKGALEYLDEIGDDSIKVHLDSYHMNIEESGMIAPVLAAADRLGYVHIGESHRGYLGSGTVDFDQFFRGLALTGYDGPIAFESFSTAVVDDILSVSLAVWRNLWDDSDDLGRHANDFIRGKLRAVETIALH